MTDYDTVMFDYSTVWSREQTMDPLEPNLQKPGVKGTVMVFLLLSYKESQ